MNNRMHFIPVVLSLFSCLLVFTHPMTPLGYGTVALFCVASAIAYFLSYCLEWGKKGWYWCDMVCTYLWFFTGFLYLSMFMRSMRLLE